MVYFCRNLTRMEKLKLFLVDNFDFTDALLFPFFETFCYFQIYFSCDRFSFFVLLNWLILILLA